MRPMRRGLAVPVSVLVALIAVFASVPAAEIPPDRLHAIPEGARESRPRGPKTPPTGAEIVNPAEFCRSDAMVIFWKSYHAQELTDMCRAVARDDRVYCCVSSSSEQAAAAAHLSAAGVEMGNVDFHMTYNGSVWIRDYGPFCVYDDGRLSITDCEYGIGGLFDAIPVSIAQNEGLPWFRSTLLHHGGNHITDGNGTGFFSENLTDFNSGWTMEEIEDEMAAYLGLESLVVFGTMEGDVTGHCDMFVKLLNDTLFVVGEYAEPGDAVGDDAAFLNDLAATLADTKNVDGRYFEVRRIPMNPIDAVHDYNRTYTNSLIFNNKVLVPTYDTELDAPALQVYAACMPGHEIIGIDCRDVIQYLGAIHCISNTIHDANPLIILHAPPATAQFGDTPLLDCRLNPRFGDRVVELHYRPAGGARATTIDAVFDNGVWHAQLPPVADDFDYWFTARVFTPADTLETVLPETAPASVFTVDVQGSTAADPLPRAAHSLSVWPNPCNPRAVLAFTLDREATVDLAVYDAAGRRVNTLASARPLPPGEHRFAWDGTDAAGRALPSALYLARLSAAGTRLTERITLLR